MNKKTLELFAEEIKHVAYDENRRRVADVVIDVAKKVNSRFDEKKFLRACGLLFDSE